jgi:protein O-GlcNAc transferase
LGNLLKDLFLLDDAIQCYKQALAIKPDFAAACFNLALTLEQKGRRIEAVFYFQQTIKMKPEHLKAHQKLAQLLPDSNRPDEAEEHAREVQWLLPRQKVFYTRTPVWTPPDYQGLFA